MTRVIFALLLLNLAACSSMRTVSIESAMQASPPPGVREGSLVEVRTLDGQVETFRVTDVTEAGLGGSPGFFPYANMRSLKAEKPPGSSSEAWSVVLGLLGLAALVALVANADSAQVCGVGGCPASQP